MIKLRAIIETESCKTENMQKEVTKILEEFNDYTT